MPGLPQFEGKAFGARLLAYPLLMLIAPAAWVVAVHLRDRSRSVAAIARDPTLPWDAFLALMLPFFIDVTGNTLDLYDQIWWWDDLNHLVNWFLLSLGVGLLLRRGDVRPAWALALCVAGLGALLAIAWELSEYVTFIRGGTELDTAYEDTLGDEALGTLGSILAAFLILRRARADATGDHA